MTDERRDDDRAAWRRSPRGEATARRDGAAAKSEQD